MQTNLVLVPSNPRSYLGNLVAIRPYLRPVISRLGKEAAASRSSLEAFMTDVCKSLPHILPLDEQQAAAILSQAERRPGFVADATAWLAAERPETARRLDDLLYRHLPGKLIARGRGYVARLAALYRDGRETFAKKDTSAAAA